mgnify:CR=1 FL=1
MSAVCWLLSLPSGSSRSYYSLSQLTLILLLECRMLVIGNRGIPLLHPPTTIFINYYQSQAHDMVIAASKLAETEYSNCLLGKPIIFKLRMHYYYREIFAVYDG